MKSISERDLAVVISVLAEKIRDLTLALRARDTCGDAQADAGDGDRMALQEILLQYDVVMESLREEYEQALAEGVVLPGFDELTRAFRVDAG